MRLLLGLLAVVLATLIHIKGETETKLLKITLEEENKTMQKDDDIERRLKSQFQNSSHHLNVTLLELTQRLEVQIKDHNQISETEIKALKEKISNLEEKIVEESRTMHELNHRLGNTTAYLTLRAG